MNWDWKNRWNNYLIEEINENEKMYKKHKRVCKVLNYIEHSLFAISAVTGSVSISAFAPSWDSNRNYEFYNKIKNLCNNDRI